MFFRPIVVLVLSLLGAACSTTQAVHDPHKDLGLLWVKHAAEYRALSLQVYQAATLALPGFIEDRSWTVVPGNPDLRDLPPAVILDVDETVVSNVDFQLSFERPFENWKLEAWTAATPATPVPGVAAFVAAARAAGAEVFFVTNRPCEPIEGGPDPCPQKATTVQDILEVGIETDAGHVLLSEEQGWNREKLPRRQHVARTHRVIMLIGDDLGDFVPCVRTKPYPPCTAPATPESRRALVRNHEHLWGNGFYVLPNPMHGSWTSQVE
jgi:acid phosphatase